MFGVFEKDKPCRYPEHKVHPSWSNHIYQTFEEAEAYARCWMGEWDPGIGVLQLGVPFDISGYGDMLEIREI